MGPCTALLYVFFFLHPSLLQSMRPLPCYLIHRVWPFPLPPGALYPKAGWKYLCNVSFDKYVLGRACFPMHNVNLVHRHLGWPRVRQMGATTLPNLDRVLQQSLPPSTLGFPQARPYDNVFSVLSLHWDTEIRLICQLYIWKISFNHKVSELWEYQVKAQDEKRIASGHACVKRSWDRNS